LINHMECFFVIGGGANWTHLKNGLVHMPILLLRTRLSEIFFGFKL
jgi:hypothetical protein